MADGVLAFEIVTADGEQRRVTADADPELYWALRGGGGDIAIVTALEIQLQSAPLVYGGRQLWPASHAHEVAAIFRSMTESAPDELTLWLELLSFPGNAPMIAIDSVFLGDAVIARKLMHPTEQLPAPLSDTRAAISAAELGTITAEPTDPSPGQSRAELLRGLDDATLGTLLDEPIAPLLSVQIRHLGGALQRPSDNPHGALDQPYAVYMFGLAPNWDAAEAVRRKQAKLADALPVSGRKPITFLNQTESLQDALPIESIQRLRHVKNMHDPTGIIRGNFGIGG